MIDGITDERLTDRNPLSICVDYNKRTRQNDAREQHLSRSAAFKLRLLRLQNDHVSSIADNVVDYFIRYLCSVPDHTKRNPDFVRQFRNALELLNDYRYKLQKENKRFAYSRSLVVLLTKYVVLERDHYHYVRQRTRRAPHEKDVVRKVLCLLQNLCADPSKDNTHPHVCTVRALHVLRQVVTTDGEKNGRFVDNMIRRLLGKLGLLAKFDNYHKNRNLLTNGELELLRSGANYDEVVRCRMELDDYSDDKINRKPYDERLLMPKPVKEEQVVDEAPATEECAIGYGDNDLESYDRFSHRKELNVEDGERLDDLVLPYRRRSRCTTNSLRVNNGNVCDKTSTKDANYYRTYFSKVLDEHAFSNNRIKDKCLPDKHTKTVANGGIGLDDDSDDDVIIVDVKQERPVRNNNNNCKAYVVLNPQSIVLSSDDEDVTVSETVQIIAQTNIPVNSNSKQNVDTISNAIETVNSKKTSEIVTDSRGLNDARCKNYRINVKSMNLLMKKSTTTTSEEQVTRPSIAETELLNEEEALLNDEEEVASNAEMREEDEDRLLSENVQHIAANKQELPSIKNIDPGHVEAEETAKQVDNVLVDEERIPLKSHQVSCLEESSETELCALTIPLIKREEFVACTVETTNAMAMVNVPVIPQENQVLVRLPEIKEGRIEEVERVVTEETAELQVDDEEIVRNQFATTENVVVLLENYQSTFTVVEATQTVIEVVYQSVQTLVLQPESASIATTIETIEKEAVYLYTVHQVMTACMYVATVEPCATAIATVAKTESFVAESTSAKSSEIEGPLVDFMLLVETASSCEKVELVPEEAAKNDKHFKTAEFLQNESLNNNNGLKVKGKQAKKKTAGMGNRKRRTFGLNKKNNNGTTRKIRQYSDDLIDREPDTFAEKFVANSEPKKTTYAAPQTEEILAVVTSDDSSDDKLVIALSDSEPERDAEKIGEEEPPDDILVTISIPEGEEVFLANENTEDDTPLLVRLSKQKKDKKRMETTPAKKITSESYDDNAVADILDSLTPYEQAVNFFNKPEKKKKLGKRIRTKAAIKEYERAGEECNANIEVLSVAEEEINTPPNGHVNTDSVKGVSTKKTPVKRGRRKRIKPHSIVQDENCFKSEIVLESLKSPSVKSVSEPIAFSSKVVLEIENTEKSPKKERRDTNKTSKNKAKQSHDDDVIINDRKTNQTVESTKKNNKRRSSDKSNDDFIKKFVKAKENDEKRTATEVKCSEMDKINLKENQRQSDFKAYKTSKQAPERRKNTSIDILFNQYIKKKDEKAASSGNENQSAGKQKEDQTGDPLNTFPCNKLNEKPQESSTVPATKLNRTDFFKDYECKKSERDKIENEKPPVDAVNSLKTDATFARDDVKKMAEESSTKKVVVEAIPTVVPFRKRKHCQETDGDKPKAKLQARKKGIDDIISHLKQKGNSLIATDESKSEQNRKQLSKKPLVVDERKRKSTTDKENANDTVSESGNVPDCVNNADIVPTDAQPIVAVGSIEWLEKNDFVHEELVTNEPESQEKSIIVSVYPLQFSTDNTKPVDECQSVNENKIDADIKELRQMEPIETAVLNDDDLVAKESIDNVEKDTLNIKTTVIIKEQKHETVEETVEMETVKTMEDSQEAKLEDGGEQTATILDSVASEMTMLEETDKIVVETFVAECQRSLNVNESDVEVLSEPVKLDSATLVESMQTSDSTVDKVIEIECKVVNESERHVDEIGEANETHIFDNCMVVEEVEIATAEDNAVYLTDDGGFVEEADDELNCSIVTDEICLLPQDEDKTVEESLSHHEEHAGSVEKKIVPEEIVESNVADVKVMVDATNSEHEEQEEICEIVAEEGKRSGETKETIPVVEGDALAPDDRLKKNLSPPVEETMTPNDDALKEAVVHVLQEPLPSSQEVDNERSGLQIPAVDECQGGVRIEEVPTRNETTVENDGNVEYLQVEKENKPEYDSNNSECRENTKDSDVAAALIVMEEALEMALSTVIAANVQEENTADGKMDVIEEAAIGNIEFVEQTIETTSEVVEEERLVANPEDNVTEESSVVDAALDGNDMQQHSNEIYVSSEIHFDTEHYVRTEPVSVTLHDTTNLVDTLKNATAKMCMTTDPRLSMKMAKGDLQDKTMQNKTNLEDLSISDKNTRVIPEGTQASCSILEVPCNANEGTIVEPCEEEITNFIQTYVDNSMRKEAAVTGVVTVSTECRDAAVEKSKMSYYGSGQENNDHEYYGPADHLVSGKCDRDIKRPSNKDGQVGMIESNIEVALEDNDTLYPLFKTDIGSIMAEDVSVVGDVIQVDAPSDYVFNESDNQLSLSFMNDDLNQTDTITIDDDGGPNVATTGIARSSAATTVLFPKTECEDYHEDDWTTPSIADNLPPDAIEQYDHYEAQVVAPFANNWSDSYVVPDKMYQREMQEFAKGDDMSLLPAGDALNKQTCLTETSNVVERILKSCPDNLPPVIVQEASESGGSIIVATPRRVSPCTNHGTISIDAESMSTMPISETRAMTVGGETDCLDLSDMDSINFTPHMLPQHHNSLAPQHPPSHQQLQTSSQPLLNVYPGANQPKKTLQSMWPPTVSKMELISRCSPTATESKDGESKDDDRNVKFRHSNHETSTIPQKFGALIDIYNLQKKSSGANNNNGNINGAKRKKANIIGDFPVRVNSRTPVVTSKKKPSPRLHARSPLLNSTANTPSTPSSASIASSFSSPPSSPPPPSPERSSPIFNARSYITHVPEERMSPTFGARADYNARMKLLKETSPLRTYMSPLMAKGSVPLNRRKSCDVNDAKLAPASKAPSPVMPAREIAMRLANGRMKESTDEQPSPLRKRCTVEETYANKYDIIKLRQRQQTIDSRMTTAPRVIKQQDAKPNAAAKPADRQRELNAERKRRDDPMPIKKEPPARNRSEFLFDNMLKEDQMKARQASKMEEKNVRNAEPTSNSHRKHKLAESSRNDEPDAKRSRKVPLKSDNNPEEAAGSSSIKKHNQQESLQSRRDLHTKREYENDRDNLFAPECSTVRRDHYNAKDKNVPRHSVNNYGDKEVRKDDHRTIDKRSRFGGDSMRREPHNGRSSNVANRETLMRNQQSNNNRHHHPNASNQRSSSMQSAARSNNHHPPALSNLRLVDPKKNPNAGRKYDVNHCSNSPMTSSNSDSMSPLLGCANPRRHYASNAVADNANKFLAPPAPFRVVSHKSGHQNSNDDTDWRQSIMPYLNEQDTYSDAVMPKARRKQDHGPR